MALLKNKNKSQSVNFNFNDAQDVDLKDLDKKSFEASIESDRDYRDVAKYIVIQTVAQLNEQNNSKNSLKSEFSKFFKNLILIQLIALFVIVLFSGFLPCFKIGDKILITLISSMFVETLGAIIIMIRYAFDSNQEVEILRILSAVVERYQKFDRNDNSNKHNN